MRVHVLRYDLQEGSDAESTARIYLDMWLPRTGTKPHGSQNILGGEMLGRYAHESTLFMGDDE